MGDLTKLNTDIVWVKIVYPDLSTYIFRGTCCKDICISLGLAEPDSNVILDVTKRKYVNVTDCEVSIDSVKPSYERSVDEFASRFV